MGVFRRARSQVALSSFMAVGKDEMGAGPQRQLTLDAEHWSALLDKLEAARGEAQAMLRSPNAALTLCEADKVSALRHYHEVYELATRLLPLPAVRWAQWRDGLQTFFADDIGDDSSGTSGMELRQCRAGLLEAQWRAQEVAFWGSTAGLAASFARLAQHTIHDSNNAIIRVKESAGEDDVSDAEGAAAIDNKADQLATFVQRHFRALHGFTQLCHFAQHLYADYASIGTLQRSWLSEMLLDETVAAAVEHVIRQTFRRDFRVPSCGLCDTLRREYNEFEVDEAKRPAIEALAAATIQSPWYTAAEALYRYEATSLQPSSAALTTAAAGDEGVVDDYSSHAVIWDAEANALADALARSMASSSGGGGGLAVLGLYMQRVIEKEPMSAVVNPARLDYGLVTLQRWLEYYLTHSAHRWSSETTFCARDDADLWHFVLQRHTVLLRWAMRQASIPDAQTGRWLRVTRALRAVAFAVLHCTHFYVASVMQSSAKAQRRDARVQTAWTATTAWVQTELIDLFAHALRADMAADDTEASVVSRHALQSELQLLLGQVLALCVDPHETLARAKLEVRQSLLALVQTGVSLVHDVQRELADTMALTQTLLRLLDQLQQECGRDVKLVPTVLDSYAALMRCMTTVPPAHSDAAATLVAQLGDGWVRCLGVRSASVPCAAAYLLPHLQRRGRVLVDVSYECRKALKRTRESTKPQIDRQAKDLP